MDRKLLLRSGLGVLLGLGVCVASAFVPMVKEPVNYAGGMIMLLGAVFLDSGLVKHIYGEGTPPKSSLIRLVVYLLMAVVLILLPGRLGLAEVGMRVFRGMGIAFLLLALLKFFSYTTMKEQEIQ